jgi:hypothetical protein
VLEIATVACSKSTPVAFLAAIAFLSCFMAAGGRAMAMVDFCAANLTDIHAVAPSDEGAKAYTYRLVAFTPGTVDATILADTDHGWKTWRIESVVLSRAKRAGDAPGSAANVPLDVAQSSTLAVSLPVTLRVAHVWVSAANGHLCEPPSFGGGELIDWQLGRSMDAERNVTASSQAADAAPPFEAVCATPFVAATVVKAVAPDLSDAARRTIDETGGESIAFAVAIDTTGKLQDTWPLGAVGSVADFERTSYVAAKRSSYRSAISYCRAVPAIYIFTATATPD